MADFGLTRPMVQILLILIGSSVIQTKTGWRDCYCWSPADGMQAWLQSVYWSAGYDLLFTAKAMAVSFPVQCVATAARRYILSPTYCSKIDCICHLYHANVWLYCSPKSLPTLADQYQNRAIRVFVRNISTPMWTCPSELYWIVLFDFIPIRVFAANWYTLVLPSTKFVPHIIILFQLSSYTWKAHT